MHLLQFYQIRVKETSSMYLLSLGFPSILNRKKISCEESVSIQVSDFGEKV